MYNWPGYIQHMTYSQMISLCTQIGSLKDMYHFVKLDSNISVGTLVIELLNGPHEYLANGLKNDPEVIMSNDYNKSHYA